MRFEFRSDTRGYTLSLGRDLLGALVLERHWFGLLNRRHGSKVDVFQEEGAAVRTVRRVVARRLKHGYKLLRSSPASADRPPLD